jgi:hypothetical protein
MKLRFFRFLNLLGQHSLQVFAFSMLITRFEAHTINNFSSGAKLMVALLTVLSLGFPAWLHRVFWERILDRAPVLNTENTPVLPVAQL